MYFSRRRFIKGWYVEAAMIREGLIQSFSALASRIRKLHLEGTTDPLTGVINRRGLDAAVQKLTTTGARKLAIVMIDVDHFKAINDKFGHAAGDEVLKAMTVLIVAEARSEDVVRSEEHTSELQSLMRIAYAVFRLKIQKYLI